MTEDFMPDGVVKRPICKLCIHRRPAQPRDAMAGLPDLVSFKIQREMAERTEQRRREEIDHAFDGGPFIGRPPEFHDWCAAHSGVETDNPDPVSGEAPAFYFACTSVNTRDAPCQLFEEADGAAPAPHHS